MITHQARPELPLDGILVLDFSQFLAGPVAASSVADTIRTPRLVEALYKSIDSGDSVDL